MANLHRSLVIAPHWIGDAVMAEPLLRRLHARGEHLTVGALPWVAPVCLAMPQVAEVLEFPFAHGILQLKDRLHWARLLKNRFDTAYICPNSMKSALIPLFARIPQRIGYLGEARFGMLTHRLQNPIRSQCPPMVAFYSALSGATDVLGDRPRLQLAASEVKRTLNALGLERSHYYVFAPGAEYGPAKRWPARRFAELACHLDLPVVLLDSGKDAALCTDIAQRVNAKRFGHCLDLSGKTTLMQAMSLIEASKCVVSNDSGLMHVAAGLGVRQVAIFGSSSPMHTPPINDQACVVWLKDVPSYQPSLDCAPCFRRTCPLGHARCLEDVSVDLVLSCL